MKIHLATDHAGFEHKESLKGYLLAHGYEIFDHGPEKLDENDDYPDFITPCAKAISISEGDKAVIFGGSGEGEAMCANRISGVRAVVYYGGNKDILKFSREHNDANILSIGARFVTAEESYEAVTLWLNTPFSGEERHIRRLAKF
ncbi:MAG: RpiB/LacA/LacB family sugar-phosphate isomerase [Candidatus Pacebacteria bacterium]|nr:RpiB/LacA/LacB family sugar-phosphate isomerase [Candidatus Paceibacterota bacterium]